MKCFTTLQVDFMENPPRMPLPANAGMWVCANFRRSTGHALLTPPSQHTPATSLPCLFRKTRTNYSVLNSVAVCVRAHVHVVTHNSF